MFVAAAVLLPVPGRRSGRVGTRARLSGVTIGDGRRRACASTSLARAPVSAAQPRAAPGIDRLGRRAGGRRDAAARRRSVRAGQELSVAIPPLQPADAGGRGHPARRRVRGRGPAGAGQARRARRPSGRRAQHRHARQRAAAPRQGPVRHRRRRCVPASCTGSTRAPPASSWWPRTTQPTAASLRSSRRARSRRSTSRSSTAVPARPRHDRRADRPRPAPSPEDVGGAHRAAGQRARPTW